MDHTDDLDSGQVNSEDSAHGSPLDRLKQIQREAWEQGEPILVEALLDEQPQLRDDEQAVVELACHEYQLTKSKSLGESPSLEDYVQRFTTVEAELRRRLRQLDATGDAMPPTSEAPPNDSVDVTAAFNYRSTNYRSPESAGRSIGPYRLVRLIGEGGMGVVWAAEQERPVRRAVALKLIRGEVGSKEVIVRFDAERQALAMMNHENIAKVLDAGATEEGLPYFAMELVKGIPITSYCQKHQLSLRARLELFQTACEGVKHAHQKGIIHRDLKPANILVTDIDGRPVPKVIDFGLAKALDHRNRLTDDTMFTQLGQVVGTLQYMSPEQAAVSETDIDTRTDIYSLGVILYELLTGSTPLQRISIRELALLQVLEEIRANEIERPSDRIRSLDVSTISDSNFSAADQRALKSKLRGELDWIVMKSLETDRDRRYPTATDLARDIARFLDGEVIVARPPSRSYRLKKFVVKHRISLSAASLVVACLIAAVFVSTLFAFAAKRSQRREELAKQDAIAKQALAERNAETARQQALLTLDTLRMVVSEIQTQLRDVPQAGPARRELLRGTIPRLEQIATELIPKESVDRETLHAQIELGGVFYTFAFENEFQDLTPSGPSDSDDDVVQQGMKMANALFLAARKTASKMVASHPEDLSLKLNLALINERLGDVRRRQLQSDAALHFYEESLRLIDAVPGDSPENERAERARASALGRIGTVHSDRGNLDKARKLFREMHRLNTLMAEAGSPYVQPEDLLASALASGDASLKSGNPAEAIGFFYEAKEAAEEEEQRRGPSVATQRNLSIVYRWLGIACRRSDRIEEALGYYEQSCRIARQLAEADRANVMLARVEITSIDELADLKFWRGEYDDALELYVERYRVADRLATRDPSDPRAQLDLATSLTDLGLIHSRMKDREAETLGFFRRSLAIKQKLAEKDPHDLQLQRNLALSCSDLGSLSLNLGEPNEALGYFQQALAIHLKHSKIDKSNASVKRDVMYAHYRMGEVHNALTSYAQAVRSFRASLAVLDDMLAEDRQADSPEVQRKQRARLVEQIEINERYRLAAAPWDEIADGDGGRDVDLLILRLEELKKQQRFHELPQTAERLRSLNPPEAAQFYHAARGYSLAALENMGDENATSSQQALRDEHVRAALECLREALRFGWEDWERVQVDDDFAAVRDLPAFRKLLPESDKSSP